MAATSTTIKLGGLARTLVQEKLLTEEEAETIQKQANTLNVPFVSQVASSKKLTPRQVAETASSAFGFPLFDLNAINHDFLPKAIDVKLLQSYRVLGLQQRGNTLFVGLSDPTNLHALDDVKFQTGLALSPVVVEDDKLGRMIDKIVEQVDTSLQSLSVDDDIDLDFQTDDQQADSDEGTAEIDDAPVVKYIQKMLLDAINIGASDLHFEPYEKFYRIRYRVDGILREIAQPPLAIKDKIASRIKVISSLDIAEKRVPQDGRMKLVLSKNRAIDFRVSTLPLINGEKIVMRILDPTSATLGIEALGYEPEQKEALLNAVSRPYGLVLVTGPTGSGKTGSLYTCLNILNNPGINI